jgi:hypothetical protein
MERDMLVGYLGVVSGPIQPGELYAAGNQEVRHLATRHFDARGKE